MLIKTNNGEQRYQNGKSSFIRYCKKAIQKRFDESILIDKRKTF